MASECIRAGINGPKYAQRDGPMTWSGIGKGSQQAHWDVTHSISVGDGRWGTYTAPELPDSRVPALWRQRSMKAKQTLIDTFTGRVYLVGPGGYELKLSPGSVKHDLVESSVGHLMLRCYCFDAPMKPYEEVTASIVGDHFDSPPASSTLGVSSGDSSPANSSSSDPRENRAQSFKQLD